MASRGSQTMGSPNRLNDVLTRTGPEATSPNLPSRLQKRGLTCFSTKCTLTVRLLNANRSSSGAGSFKVPTEAMKRQLGEQSKKSEALSVGTERAKGWNCSRRFRYRFRFSATYGEKGEARMLRFPRAR